MVSNKVDLFLENNKALEKVKGIWTFYGYQIKSNALHCTMKNQRIETDKINLAMDVIKHHASVFSTFRGINRLTTAITLSFEHNMEESLVELIEIYNKLKEIFFSSDYLGMAALVIFNAKDRVNVDEAVKNTRVAYDYMKKHHRFLTGQEDIANAAIIATTCNELGETFKEIEECYDYLSAKKLSNSNNIQSLSHILSLINLPVNEKCGAVLEMNSTLREKNVPLKDYYVPMLGIIAFINDNKIEFAENMAEVSAYLKKQKGFGNLTLGANFRHMIAAALVALNGLEQSDQQIKDNMISHANNIALTVAIAVQTAVFVSSTTAVATTSS